MRLTRRTMLAGLVLSGCAVTRTRAPFSLQAEDGVPLSGLTYGEGRRSVLLVPGGHGIGETWDIQARRLARSGLRVLAMDYRGLGGVHDVAQDSDRAHLDVLGAARRLAEENAVTSVCVVGASWGGRAAAMASIAAPGLVERIVLLAPAAFDNPERLGGRKLFIVASQDRDGAGRLRLDSIRGQFERTPEPKRLVVLDGAAHAQLLFLTPQGGRLHAEIEEFLTAP
ncbi:MAG: alpha/beta hydrolase [Sphingosinicella sp.]